MTDDQIAEYVDLMANLIDLPLAPEHRPGVLANMVRIAQIAQVVTEFSIPNEIEAAPVFEP